MGRGLPARARTDAHTLVPYLSKLPSGVHLWLPVRRNDPDGARTSGSGRSRLGEEASRGSAGEVTLSHCTPRPPQPARAMGQDHITSTRLLSTAACTHPPPVCACFCKQRATDLQNTGFVQKAAAVSWWVPPPKTAPSPACSLGGTLPRPPLLFLPSHLSRAREG